MSTGWMKPAKRSRTRVVCEAWILLLMPVALYIYANMKTSHGDVTMIVVGIACPVIFGLAVHLELDRAARSEVETARRTQRVLTAIILLCAGLWSWIHLVEVALDAGMALYQGIAMVVLVESVLFTAIIVLHSLRRDAKADAEAVEEGQRLTIPIETATSVESEYGITIQQESDVTILYRLLSSDDELLYVGITTDLNARLANHRRTKPWFDEVADMVTRTFPSRNRAIAAEHELITTLWPLYNKMPGSHSDATTVRNGGTRTPAPAPLERRTINPAPRLRAVHDDGLEELSRDRLREVARAEGVPVRGSRAEVAERVRAARAARTDAVTPPVTDEETAS